MRYTSPTSLPELTLAADRAQAFLDATLTDLERMPTPSVEFRLEALDKVTDFIYRLTGIRKTIIALRASSARNTSGLRELTAMVRSLHQQMGGIQTTIRTPRPPRDPAFAIPRFAPNWPPAVDELIPEPRLPQSAMTNEAQQSLSAPAIDSSASTASISPTKSIDSITLCSSVGSSVSPSVLSPPSELSEPADSCDASEPADPSSQSAARNPQPGTAAITLISNLNSEISNSEKPSEQSAALSAPQPDPATALLARWPESITNPNFQLPPESNRAADYAPLLGLDLVPLARTIPVLPLTAGLDARIDAQFAHLTDTCVNLRADMLTENPNSLSDLTPYTSENASADNIPAVAPAASPSSDSALPSDSAPPQLSHSSCETDTPHASHANHSPNPPDPASLSP